jgi:tRNA nucleotidyltransferase/poly(A) polymerase
LEEDLRAAGGDVFKTTPAYYVVRGRLPDGPAADFVLARRDGPYSDGRRPDYVLPGTLHDDLARRDFTVNAIAMDADGTLIDPHGGVDDLRIGNLRTVGDAKTRFREDALRALRAIRFSVTKGLEISAETKAAMLDPEIVGRVAEVSKDRRREELEKAFRFDTLRTMEVLEHEISRDLRDAVMKDVLLRPTFTFKGEA